MSDGNDKPKIDNANPIIELLGEVHALKSIIAVLISHIALVNRSPIEKREEIILSLSSMLPSALSIIEKNSLPTAAAGFERTVEQISHMARYAVRIERLPPRTTAPPDKKA